jgi:hypothetical protein
MFRSLEACSRLCLHCGNQAAFWNQSELRIKLLLCVEFGVHDECFGFPQLCHLFELYNSCNGFRVLQDQFDFESSLI